MARFCGNERRAEPRWHASAGASAGEPFQVLKKLMKFALSLGGTLPWELVQENPFQVLKQLMKFMLSLVRRDSVRNRALESICRQGGSEGRPRPEACFTGDVCRRRDCGARNVLRLTFGIFKSQGGRFIDLLNLNREKFGGISRPSDPVTCLFQKSTEVDG